MCSVPRLRDFTRLLWLAVAALLVPPGAVTITFTTDRASVRIS